MHLYETKAVFYVVCSVLKYYFEAFFVAFFAFFVFVVFAFCVLAHVVASTSDFTLQHLFFAVQQSLTFSLFTLSQQSVFAVSFFVVLSSCALATVVKPIAANSMTPKIRFLFIVFFPFLISDLIIQS